jgi:hypothetical protein
MKQIIALLFLTVLLGVSPKNASALLATHDCSFCHDHHSAAGFTLLNQPNQADLTLTAELICLNCHGPTGSATEASVHSNGSPTDQPAFRHSCIECHDPHDNRDNGLGGTNIKLVLPQVVTPNSGLFDVVFESRGTGASEPALHSFADGDATYDGICEVCHTLTARHRNNASGSHNHQNGDTCTRCHTHDNGFNR